MNKTIKDIVDGTNIKMVTIKEDVRIPNYLIDRHGFESPVIKNLRDKFLSKITRYLIGYLDQQRFESAIGEETTIRFDGEVVMCTEKELKEVLEKVYEAGKEAYLIKLNTQNLFEDES